MTEPMALRLGGPSGTVALIDPADWPLVAGYRANLRKATPSQQMANQGPRGGTSRFKGVTRYRDGRRWQAYIGFGGRQRHLGLYEEEEEDAARAYDAAAAAQWGSHARLNLPDGAVCPGKGQTEPSEPV